MGDIVEELRQRGADSTLIANNAYVRAADEIERLRVIVAGLAAQECIDEGGFCVFCNERMSSKYGRHDDDCIWARVAGCCVSSRERRPPVSELTPSVKCTALLLELYEWALEACHQGTGREFGTPEWHLYMSVWSEAEELLPRISEFLVARNVLAAALEKDSHQ